MIPVFFGVRLWTLACKNTAVLQRKGNLMIFGFNFFELLKKNSKLKSKRLKHGYIHLCKVVDPNKANPEVEDKKNPIHWLACIFTKDFSMLGIYFRKFLYFWLLFTNIWQKSLGFGWWIFFQEIFNLWVLWAGLDFYQHFKQSFHQCFITKFNIGFRKQILHTNPITKK